ncbi:hypothetical protein LXL04_034402 [Taraxacum kok-saghyz]
MKKVEEHETFNCRGQFWHFGIWQPFFCIEIWQLLDLMFKWLHMVESLKGKCCQGQQVSLRLGSGSGVGVSSSMQMQPPQSMLTGQQMNRSSPQPTGSSNSAGGGPPNAQKGQVAQRGPHSGFTKQQFHIYGLEPTESNVLNGGKPGSVYTGVDFCKRLCGVSVIRRY